MASQHLTLEDIQAELSTLDSRYILKKIIGSGSYGVVLRAVDTQATSTSKSTSAPHTQNSHTHSTHTPNTSGPTTVTSTSTAASNTPTPTPPPTLVAIKRINAEIFESATLSKRILREIKLLSHFTDVNIVGLRNVLAPITHPPHPPTLCSLYMVMDVMETDLRQVLRSGQALTDGHVKFFLHQLLRALQVIHRAGVIHRDITPANILVNTNCDLKLCDFGLARQEEGSSENMTDYVTMRWYRAPELVMEHRHYGAKIDVWSAGLVLAEMLGSKPLCQGKDRVMQLDKIIDVTGTPTEEQITSLGSTAAQKYLSRRSSRQRLDFRAKYPTASPDALDLLDKMLVFHPAQRVSVQDALNHPYLKSYAALSAPVPEALPVFELDETPLTSVPLIQRAILTEVARFQHRMVPKTHTDTDHDTHPPKHPHTLPPASDPGQ